MVALSVAYTFTGDYTATLADPAFTASDLAKVGGGSFALSGNELRYTPGTTSTTQTANYFTFTVTPADPAQLWTPGTLSLRARKFHTSTSQGLRVRTDRDGFAGNVYSFFGLTDSFITHTIDLSPLGELTGPLTFRVYVNAGHSSAYVHFDDVVLDAAYTPAGAADQSLGPAPIASAEAFGLPSLAVVPLVLVGPEAIASAEAFGVPALAVVPLVLLGPAPIASGEAFGGLTVDVLDVGRAPYPDGAAVAAFLGSAGNPGLITLAAVHVGAITEFARVYTRGNGFHDDGIDEDVSAVVLVATARLVGNPEQLDVQVGNVRRRSFFRGWSLAERTVLNAHRGVAA